MTIYILDIDLEKSAEYLDDKSLVRQIKNIEDILVNYLSRTYKENTSVLKNKVSRYFTLMNDWVSECPENFQFLQAIGHYCSVEATNRGLFHSRILMSIHNENNKYEDSTKKTYPPLSKNEKARVKDAEGNIDYIQSIRKQYYSNLQKTKNEPTWTNRKKPQWLLL